MTDLSGVKGQEDSPCCS